MRERSSVLVASVRIGSDIGSATPGSYGAVTEVYGEGLGFHRFAYMPTAN